MLSDNSQTVYNAFYREYLPGFAGRSIEILRPGEHYQLNWHIDLIGEYLMACERGELTRLIINLPPRAMKSHTVSVAWPAWLLGRDPGRRIIVASYSSALSLKHSLDTRALMQSEWYRDLFPGTLLARGQNEKAKFMTTKRGFRLATSVGGTLTGEGGEFLILDDPHNAIHIASPVMRKRTLDWFQHTFLTRQDSPAKGCYVIVMQRLHPEDLTGFLLAKESAGQWAHLSVPAVEEAPRKYSFGSFHYARQAGEVLNLQRDSNERMAQLKADIGSHQFAAQYQQQPVAAEGRIVKPNWLDYVAQIPEGGMRVQSWDTAIKTGEGCDFTAGLTWRMTADGFYLEEVIRAALDYPALKKTILESAQKFQPEIILIEDKASGQSLIQELRALTRLPIVAISPKGDKTQRLLRTLGLFESGKIKLPQGAPWIADYERELLTFPESRHDDMVDATTQFLNWALVRERQQESWRIRVL